MRQSILFLLVQMFAFPCVATSEYLVPDVGSVWEWNMVRVHTESGEQHVSPGHSVRADRIEAGVTVFTARLGGRSLELRQHVDGIALVEPDCNGTYIPLPPVTPPNHCGWNPCTIDVGKSIEWPLYVFRRERSCVVELGVAKWVGVKTERTHVLGVEVDTVNTQASITIPGLGAGGWNTRIRAGLGEVYATSGGEQSVYTRIAVRKRTVVFKESEHARELATTQQRLQQHELACMRKPEERLIVALGDSLTAGGDGSYPEELDRLFSGHSTRFCNAGVPGDTAEKLLKRVDSVLAQKPNVVLLAIGGNDMFHGVSKALFEKRLRRVIKRLRDGGADVILLGLEVDAKIPYAGLYIKIARELGLPLIPNMLHGVYKTPSMLLEDGVHPNKDGNKQIARIVASHVFVAQQVFY